MASICSPAFMKALKDHCNEYVDRLYADAGVTEGMSSEEASKRITAEHRRREKAAKELEAQAEFWRAVERRRNTP